MPTMNHNWTDLARNIKQGRTILVLGPDAITRLRDGQRISLQSLLGEHLAALLQARDPQVRLLPNASLPYIAKTLEDTILWQEKQKRPAFSEENTRAQLYACIADFYEQQHHSDFPVYAQLAQMPFHFVVETGHAPYLEQAMDSENKFDTKCFYYHYTNPTHNNGLRFEEKDIRADAPLIYQLFGSTQQPDSMIVTERDQLAFLDSILQQENTAGIPSKVAIHFTSVKDRTAGQQFDKTFLFLGFDFNEWHLRLMLHLIGRYQRQKETYALQNPQDVGELTHFFTATTSICALWIRPPNSFWRNCKPRLTNPKRPPPPSRANSKCS